MGEWESDFKTVMFGDHHVVEWTRKQEGGTMHLFQSPRAFSAAWVPDPPVVVDPTIPVPPSRKKPRSK